MTAALPMGGNKITGGADPTISTDFATKNYVDTTTSAFFSTGDVKLTFKIVADTSWLLFDDGTFGSGSSGGSNRANNDTLALFTLFYNAPFVDANIPIFTSGGGATTRSAQGSASAAWAANCRMSLPKTLGRALAVAGSGASLTARVLGSAIGLETATLVTTNLPPYTPQVGFQASPFGLSNVSGASVANSLSQGNNGNLQQGLQSINGVVLTGTAQGGASTPVAIMPPEIFLNIMVKL